jgi:hypothetical protein
MQTAHAALASPSPPFSIIRNTPSILLDPAPTPANALAMTADTAQKPADAVY